MNPHWLKLYQILIVIACEKVVLVSLRVRTKYNESWLVECTRTQRIQKLDYLENGAPYGKILFRIVYSLFHGESPFFRQYHDFRSRLYINASYCHILEQAQLNAFIKSFDHLYFVTHCKITDKRITNNARPVEKCTRPPCHDQYLSKFYSFISLASSRKCSNTRSLSERVDTI